jgi:uncharacterized membrane protein YhhN
VNATAFLLLVLALAIAAADWIAVQRGARIAEYLLKPATMAFLIAAVLAMDPRDAGVRGWFVAALVLSLVGDVFLMLPRDLFVQGLSAFLLAHVAYIVGLHLEGVEAVPFLGGVVAAMLLLAIVGRRILAAIRSGDDDDRNLAGPVVGYMFVIAAMAASAIGTTHAAAAAGATLFVTSDALIAWNRFIQEQRYGRIAIIVTYHVGQILLAISVAD